MDKNHILSPQETKPSVRYANWHNTKKGVGWVNRRSIDPQLLLCIEGQLVFSYEDNNPITFEKGSILFIEPNKLHSLVVTKNCTLSTFHFEFLPNKTWSSNDYNLATTPDPLIKLNKDEFSQCKFLFNLLKNTFNEYAEYRLELLETTSKLILLKCFQFWDKPYEKQKSAKLQPILTFIRANLKNDINRNTIADQLHVSPAHVNLIFKNELQCTPTDFINRERCLLASKLIDQGYSIKEACYQSGFHDQGYFTKVFKKHLHVKPTQMKTINKK